MTPERLRYLDRYAGRLARTKGLHREHEYASVMRELLDEIKHLSMTTEPPGQIVPRQAIEEREG